MKINWKLRLQNKVTLTAIIMAVIALAYQIMGILGVVPSVSQDSIIETAGMVINVLALVGIVTDPTTAGISDSSNAMSYERPKEDSKNDSN